MATAEASFFWTKMAVAACLATLLIPQPDSQASAQTVAAHSSKRGAIYVDVTDKLDVSRVNLEPSILVTIRIHNETTTAYKNATLEYVASDGAHDILDALKSIPSLPAGSVIPLEIRLPYKAIEIPAKLIISSIYVSPGGSTVNLFDHKSASPNEFKLTSSALPKRLKDAREMYRNVESMIGTFPPLAGSEKSAVTIEEAHLLLPGDAGNRTTEAVVSGRVRNNSNITCSSVRLFVSLYESSKTMDFSAAKEEAAPMLANTVAFGLGEPTAGDFDRLNRDYADLKAKLGRKWLSSGSADTKTLVPGGRWDFRVPFKVSPGQKFRPVIEQLGFAQQINPG